MIKRKISQQLLLTSLSLVLALASANGQSLTLEECYKLAKENYPAVKKLALVEKSAGYTMKNLNKRFLPQFNVNGQATYQSQVVDYGDLLGSGTGAIGIVPPSFSKDQYKLQGEVEQLLFEGGNTRYEKAISRANSELEQQNIQVELYAVNDRINSIFFSIFVIDAQLELNNFKIANLQAQLQKTEGAYTYGTAYLSDVNELKAEIESTKAANIDYKGNSSSFLRMLSLFIGREINSSGSLVKPAPPVYAGEIQRPELKLYDLQKNNYETQSRQLKSGYLTTVKAFFQGAYGRPTLNPISNDFGPWYVTGIRLNWSLGSLYTMKNQRGLYEVKSQTSNAERETFLRNLEMDIVQQDENVKKYRQLIMQDRTTIELRETVTQSASAQLANGIITTYEYIQKLNLENSAKQNLILHEIQLLQAQYNLKFKSGN